MEHGVAKSRSSGTGKLAVLTVPLRNGETREVDVLAVIEPFCIHAGINDKPFALTHMGTLHRVSGFDSVAEARAFVQAVLSLNLDWSFSSHAQMPDDLSKAMHKFMRSWRWPPAELETR
jgi:hypothetical protein